MPRAWANRRLADHAVLLVDGVDELAPNRRDAVRNWLDELITAYPELPVVVTSRGGAVREAWLDDLGFRSVELQPMSAADVIGFCERWHLAVRDTARDAPTTVPCAESELPEYESALRRHLDARRDMRRLATNPLMCALMCTLNLYGRRNLPRDRMGLYEAALQMLVERRDTERGVPSRTDLPLDSRSKIVILQYLAWKMTTGNRVELPRDRAVQHVEEALRRLPWVAEPGEVLDFLLDRDIVIRRPVHGRVDFVHRTFLEYLAAKEAVDTHDIHTLVAHAHLAQWWATVIMAAGHAPMVECTELLNELLKQATRESQHARRLHLLAGACLETPRMLEPEIRAAVYKGLERLIPPRSVREAASLATAGEGVLCRLPPSLQGLHEGVAAACVRTAALINGRDALRLLAEYASDGRHAVQRELVAAWHYFDAEEYVDTVLADAPLQDGRIWVDRVEHVRLARRLNRLTDLRISLSEPVRDLAFLDNVPNLSHLYLATVANLDLSPLREHNQLVDVGFFNSDASAGFDVLTALPQLKSLTIGLAGTHSLDFLIDASRLEQLALRNLEKVVDIDPIAELGESRRCPSNRARSTHHLSLAGFPS